MPEAPNSKIRQTPPAPRQAAPSPQPYAELAVTSNFSFLRGASQPDELVFRAAELGYRAIAITDRNSLAGVVRAHDAIRQVREQGGIPPQLIIGARLVLADGPELLVWPGDRAAYGRLCRLLTLGKRRAEKGECLLYLQDFLDHQEGMLAAIVFCSTGYQPVTKQELATDGHRCTQIEKNEPALPCGPSGEFPLRLARQNESPESILRQMMGDRLSLAVSADYGADDQSHLARAARVSETFNIPLLAINDVHYHEPSRKKLQDVLTCIRHGCTIAEAGYRLFPNAERYLKPAAQMHRLFADRPQAIARGLEIAERCSFSLDELRYEYPHELVPQGLQPIDYLRRLAYVGAAERYGNPSPDTAPELLNICSRPLPDALTHSIPAKVRQLLDHELALIEQLHFEAYFLTVHDLVIFARSRGILCQGRGSAANSAVCYCLGVTSVDPARIDVLFERFISAARNEPPDIDIDFEHERREEVLQYIYEKYGRDRAGMTAEVITYRGRSAVRDVGKALGFSLDMVDQMAKKLDWWHRGTISDEMLAQLGLDSGDRTIRQVIDLTGQLLGFPRHLSQHVGGMVMTRGPLCEMVPIENASMPGRTVIEWDKDDIDALGILKVDALALGMLTCISKAFKLVNQRQGGASCLQLHTIPPEDPAVYDMISDADTIGVFQIESRAQMTMLPRLRPRCFYDLVIEVAIVRPGPIQGDMVHPYLRRRNGEEPVSYPSEALKNVLEKTLGVPLFQEQAMRVAMVGASFSAAEADQLRRAMAAWRKSGAIEGFHEKIVRGMLANGYTKEFAEQCFNQIKGFGEYGFPESHAASFALLVYVSAWLKRYHPAAFAAALLNSQPMGFYAPAQIVRDARDHGVKVRPVDVNFSDWDCTLEEEGTKAGCASARPTSPRSAHQNREARSEKRDDHSGLSTQHSGLHSDSSFILPPSSLKSSWGQSGPAVRLGMRMIKGFRQSWAQQIEAARRHGCFATIAQFHRATGLPVSAIRALAEADVFGSLGLSRRQALWQVLDLKDEQAPLFDQLLSRPNNMSTELPVMPEGQEVLTDYATTTLSLKKHPVALVRAHLDELGISTAKTIANTPHGAWMRVAGLVLIRQRPGTASGIVFETLEDETGTVNLIVKPEIYDRYRSAARGAMLLRCDGRVQRQGQVIHVMARRLYDLSSLLAGHEFRSRDFH